MNFLNPFFIILCSTGAVFAISGLYMMRRPPKKINHFYGYRSKTSMKNQERWDFAQMYSAKALMKYGLVLSLLSLLDLVFSFGEGKLIMVISIIIIIVVPLIMIYHIESTIKAKFRG